MQYSLSTLATESTDDLPSRSKGHIWLLVHGWTDKIRETEKINKILSIPMGHVITTVGSVAVMSL